jgi:hypothetical protein
MPNGFWNFISMDELIIKTPKQNVVTIKKIDLERDFAADVC